MRIRCWAPNSGQKKGAAGARLLCSGWRCDSVGCAPSVRAVQSTLPRRPSGGRRAKLLVNPSPKRNPRLPGYCFRVSCATTIHSWHISHGAFQAALASPSQCCERSSFRSCPALRRGDRLNKSGVGSSLVVASFAPKRTLPLAWFDLWISLNTALRVCFGSPALWRTEAKRRSVPNERHS